jgi:predicted O-methyltransferase YrrM
MDPAKAGKAAENLAAAGLDDVVEVRVGDAFETLSDLDEVDLLFLDGWNNLYVPLLERLEPRLSGGALVVADLSADDPELGPYCERMHDPGSGYVSVDVPLDAGVVVSLRT